MAERTYEDAVETLQRRVGGQFSGTREEGHRQMLNVLHDELGCSKDEARDTLERLIRSGKVRYIVSDGDEGNRDSAGTPTPPIAIAVNTTGGSGIPAVSAPNEKLPAPGRWEIGTAEDSGIMGVRKGQVRPPE